MKILYVVVPQAGLITSFTNIQLLKIIGVVNLFEQLPKCD